MKNPLLPLAAALVAAALLLVPADAAAQQFVYQPTNPAFGGSPVNYSWMLNSAQIQNRYEDTSAISRFERDPFADFESNLQRQILNELSRQLVQNRFGEDLVDLEQEGSFDLGDFLIDVLPGQEEGLSIRIFNKLTGAESVITVPQTF